MSITTTARRLTAALVLSGALCGLGAGVASAATPAVTAGAAAPTVSSTAQSAGSTGIIMTIVNNSDADLNLGGVRSPYGDLVDQPVQVLAAHATTTVSVKSLSIEGAELDVQYLTPAGNVLDFFEVVPLSSKDNANGTSYDSAFTVSLSSDPTGWHPSTTFTINPA